VAFALSITAIAVIGKVLGCGLGARLAGLSLREAVIIGVGMNGRGAVELVVATVVINLSIKLLANGVISEPLLTANQFSALVFMAFVTTMMTPVLLKWAVARSCTGRESASFCAIWRGTANRK
jgi:Kef-type K+ transport system membrane component KefB